MTDKFLDSYGPTDVAFGCDTLYALIEMGADPMTFNQIKVTESIKEGKTVHTRN